MTKGEKLIDEYEVLYDTLQIKPCMRKSLTILLNLFNQKRPAKVLSIFKKVNACDYRIQTAELNQMQEQFFQMWNDQTLDAILSPSFAIPALKQGYSKDLGLCASYCFIWNLLNLPTGSLPVTIVFQDEQNYKNNTIHDIISAKVDDSMKNTEGLPIGVQVSTLPYQEEKCLNIMRQLEGEIKFYQKHNLPNININNKQQSD